MAVEPEDVLGTYKRWNDALCDYFFNTGRANQRVFLSVDEITIGRIGEQLGCTGDPAEDFTNAIRHLDHPERIIRGMVSWGRQWARHRGKAPPLFVAGLAVSVLAASHMGADPGQGIAAHNYYTHLNELLGRDPSAGCPDGFEQMPWLWDLLREWLEVVCKGRLGLASARQMGPAYVGWPISQALVRRADARELRLLSRMVGADDLDELTAEDLLPPLKRWLREQGAGSRLARLLSNRPSEVNLLQAADQLARMLPELEGEDPDAGQPQQLMAQLHIHCARFELSAATPQLAWRCPPDAEDDLEVKLPSGDVCTIPVRGEWVGLHAEPVWFSHYVSLECDGHRVTSNPGSPPMVFLMGDGYGRPGWWVLRHQEIALHEPCMIAVPPWQFGPVKEELVAADQGWKVHTGLGWLPVGWVLFSDVVFRRPPEHVFKDYQQRAYQPWTLAGGVHIRNGTWLEGYLPRIGAAPDISFEIVLVGEGAVEQASGGTDLNDLGLRAGTYIIRGDGVRAKRITIAIPDSLPYVREDRWLELGGEGAPTVRVRGAYVYGAMGLPAPRFFPAGPGYLLIGPRIGEVESLPASAGTFGLREWTGTFEPVWQLRVKGRKVQSVTALQQIPPAPALEPRGNRSHRERWGELIIASRNRLTGLTSQQRPMFQRYLQLARRRNP